jgi:electron transfer flavoprotein-quinone oxidoreductase
MKTYSFDVIVIGAGPAGVSAAGALAGSGISVALIEAGAYAGAENWSGCVYFAESLAEPDCFGPAIVQAAPFERPVVRRGTLLHNGLDDLGVALTDPAAFRHCYTVLRPVFDPYFAAAAQAKGAVLLSRTTVTGLIRKAGRVIGVSTDRGPLYSDVVFIAEGDASHLVRSERLERVERPHFLQGVKAVYTLPPAEIERRFRLHPGQGAAYEILVRNAAIAGRTARLNAGGFLYTNRDSLSFGYVLPLENLARNFRGDHGQLLEWMRSLPHLGDLLQGAQLSAWGAKIIRSGGWRERPLLVEDGLAVGGASAGLGIDIPFPNFTGPASATGLFFARAVRGLLQEGRSLDRTNLTRAYLDPLLSSVHGRNARHLSRWPGYFGRSRVLFGRTVNAACGTARFLSTGGLIDTGRFLRNELFSPRGLRELATDTTAALRALRLGGPLLRTLAHPGTWLAWALNQFRRQPPPDDRLTAEMHLEGRSVDPASLPRPIGGLVRRTAPAIARALAAVYANDTVPARDKFAAALRTVLRAFRASDLLVLPLYALVLAIAAAATAAWDAFRYYILRIPAARLLAEPVMAYAESLRKARALDGGKPSVTMEAKLATNTYHVGHASHIRTAWPTAPAKHGDMANAGLWWLCPARVYSYDAPLFGRGAVTVNWENCIKCESCWRAEPSFALWGRFTDHGLVYRPSTAALPLLLGSLPRLAPSSPAQTPLRSIDKKLWYTDPAVTRAAQEIGTAAAAFIDAVAGLPFAADRTRLDWPVRLGKRLCGTMERLERALTAEGHHDAARDVATERTAIARHLADGTTFHALYGARRFVQRLRAWLGSSSVPHSESGAADAERALALTYDDVAGLFPDRIVKTWEEEPMPQEWAEKLRAFLATHRQHDRALVRTLSAVSPALGLVAAAQLAALRLLAAAGEHSLPGLAAMDGSALALTPDDNGTTVRGTLTFVPSAAAAGILVIAGNKAYPVPFDSPGVTVTPAPSIGFRAAGLADVAFDCVVARANVLDVPDGAVPDHASYLAIALGAGDYLSRRAQEHAAGRVQFPGQMLDTGGRDGIAKLGAVKAMIARIEAWRLMLETLSEVVPLLPPEATALFGPLSSAAAALAFGPENGCMAYDAGQVFGGFAYSEDDLLSRSYRDSSLFRFLIPGHGAAEQLASATADRPLASVLADALGPLPDGAGPLDGSVARWKRAAATIEALPRDADRKLRGDAIAVLLGCRAVLVRVEQAIGSGRSREAEAACVEVLLERADHATAAAALSGGSGVVAPHALFPLEPAGEQAALEKDYASFCSRPGPAHRSGQFLLSVFDRSPRYVPEMQLHDRELRERWRGLVAWFRKNCSERSIDGLHFERAVEKAHDLPQDIVDSVRANRWLATYIPATEGGLGWRKADYYALNSAAGSFGDAGICLLIMASTSIGTTPVLLGLEEELPRVREELEPLVRDEGPIGGIGRRVKRLVASFANPNPSRIRKEYRSVMTLVDGRIRHTRVVKYLAANFLKAFYGAGIAGQRGDFGVFVSELTRAAELIDRLLPDIKAALEELPRRERSHRLFLKNLGHGGVSAFALTEPTAGSDSGGVKTTAALRSAMLTALPDGRYVFAPTGDMDRCRRYLIDADRIVFTDRGMAYLTPDNSRAEIKYDRYDRATDEGVRYYEHQGAACEFHDIAQVRSTDRGPLYEYYSVTGAKMWITNGAVATQFSLYARSVEGVTAFMVDRYAEGLKVGADERKMGQRGSPTNEISLDSVRVPREAVIGYEGHGQVNALETLNAGRCGLAVVSGAFGRKFLDETRRRTQLSPERDRLLGEAVSIQFGSESVAYYLIGLFDRPHESVRMESAIAKYLCAEDIHEMLTLAERAMGPSGQTERHLIEKVRRDIRILNIYEGTNEVQRFLILKDLIAMAADWPELPERFPERPSDARARTLARWKNRVRLHARAAAGMLGDAAWADAMLQPAFLPMAEMAGEVLRLECIWSRMEWLEANRRALGDRYVDDLCGAGERAAVRTHGRLARLDRLCGELGDQVRALRSAPEVVAADALLERAARAWAEDRPTVVPAASGVRVLCILRPLADLSPAPRLDRGRLQELLWDIDPLDRAGLDQALAIKAAGDQVTVHVLMAGPSGHEELLRDAAAGADAFFRLDGEQDEGTIARALQDLERSAGYDAIVCGKGARDGSAGLASFLAGYLGRELVTPLRLSAVREGPSVVAITAPSSPEKRGMDALLESRLRPVTVVAPGREAFEPPVFSEPAAAMGQVKLITTVSAAAERLLAYAAAERAAAAAPYGGDVGTSPLHRGPAAWALIDRKEDKANTAALRAARTCADLFGIKACAFVATPREDWPAVLGLVRTNGIDSAYCIDLSSGALAEAGRTGIIEALVAASGKPMLFGGSAWDSAFGRSAGRMAAAGGDPRLARACSSIGKGPEGMLLVASPAYGGKLVREGSLPDGAAFVTLRDDAVVSAGDAARSLSAYAVDLPAAPGIRRAGPVGPRPGDGTESETGEAGTGADARSHAQGHAGPQAAPAGRPDRPDRRAREPEARHRARDLGRTAAHRLDRDARGSALFQQGPRGAAHETEPHASRAARASRRRRPVRDRPGTDRQAEIGEWSRTGRRNSRSRKVSPSGSRISTSACNHRGGPPGGYPAPTSARSESRPSSCRSSGYDLQARPRGRVRPRRREKRSVRPGHHGPGPSV